MNVKHWLFIHALGRKLVSWSESKMSAERDGRLFCADCGKAMRRGDKFMVLSVQHNDCNDPRQVTVVGLGCPEPLRTMLANEVGD